MGKGEEEDEHVGKEDKRREDRRRYIVSGS